MKRLVLGLAALSLGALAAGEASAQVGRFTGQWFNVDPNTQGVTRVVIVEENGRLVLRVFGRCQPTDCDLGPTEGRAFGVNPGQNPLATTQVIVAQYEQNGVKMLVIVEAIGPNRLRVRVITTFEDNSGRQNFSEVVELTRTPAAAPPPAAPPAPMPPAPPAPPAPMPPAPPAPMPPPPPMPPAPPAPMPPAPPAPLPPPPPGPVVEDCIGFNPMTANVAFVGGQWKIVDGGHQMMAFGMKHAEAVRSLQIIRAYGFNRICFVGRPGPSLVYFKRFNAVASGGIGGEDCIAFNPFTSTIRFVAGRFVIADGNHAVMSFPNLAEAQRALAILRMHGVRAQCFVGRPGPSMTYLKR